jgi:hypothetical protein
VLLTIQAGEKSSQNYRLEVNNPGGHSSRPVKDNAIYRLAAGLTQLSQYEFPIQLNETTRTYFSRVSDIVDSAKGAAKKAQVRNASDAYDLCGDDSRCRARDERFAAACSCQRELSHLSRHER